MKNPRMRTEWDLTMLYKNDNDPAIERDLAEFEKAAVAFVARYESAGDWLTDPHMLAEAIRAYESLISMRGCIAPRYYFFFRSDIDSADMKVRARMTQLEARFNKTQNTFVFFVLRIGRIPKEMQQIMLADAELAPFRYFLKTAFENARHDLTEVEEKILNLTNQPARDMWIEGMKKILNDRSIMWKGKVMPVTEAFARVTMMPTKDRRAVWKLLMENMKGIADVAESELNALFTMRKIEDELRGFAEPFSQTVLSYENEDATVRTVVDTVTKHFKVAHRFYRLKARLLKEKYLTYADRSAPVGTTTSKFVFADAVEILQKAFARFDEKYVHMLNEFVLSGRVDVFSRKGKTGGAYCAGAWGVPTYVLLNHANHFDSVMTFGHEMGHAFHTELSKSQRPLYADYTTSVAEVASTFFENLVFEEAFSRLSDKEKIVALHDRLNGKIATVFRQIACFNFEYAAHRMVREKGHVSHEEFAKLMNAHMKAYMGPTFKLTPDDGYMFVNWSHLRRHFYVYSYAFGELVSDALYAEYKKDVAFRQKIEKFLSAGGSARPEDIFAHIGIDVRHPKFFEEGIKQIEVDLAELERLTKNKK